MNDVQLGRTLRALRRHLGLRQIDLGERAGVSQQWVSDIERGRAAHVTHGTLRRLFLAVDADAVTFVRWRGGELDRLLDEGHADIVGRIVQLLGRRGWQVLTEVTYSEWGERGSVDVLAWHPATRTVLVVEVKTEVASAEELLRRHDAKVRLAPTLALDRFGERPAAIGRLLVVADSPTNRRRVERLRAVIGTAYPARGRDVRLWLRRPAGSLAGAMFIAGSRDRQVRSRHRLHRSAA
jgi:transcriptional regulator with XRE-family HTH domain